MNRAGERCLYLAEDDATAVAESRSSKGQSLSVARVRLVRDVQIIDLVADDAASFWHKFITDQIGVVCSDPVYRYDRLKYAGSQYFTRLCKEIGGPTLDGVRFPSAMRKEGVNLVLFEKLDVDCDSYVECLPPVELWKVDEVHVDATRVLR